MAKIHTHYDNLMVSRGAPAEVIRASYLALSKKFHPDVNPSKDAPRIMKIINTSYEVLSDPEKRRLYDFQVRETELRTVYGQAESDTVSSTSASSTNEKSEKVFLRFLNKKPTLKALTLSLLNFLEWLLGFMARNPRVAFIAVIFSIGWMSSFWKDSSDNSSPQSYVTKRSYEAEKIRSKRSVDIGQRKSYQKPSIAPNGYSWPDRSAYLDGYKRLNKKGRSTVQVENFQNDNEFYVKLIDSTDSKAVAVRHALIKGGDEFVFEDVSPGKYKLMYMDLDTGSLTKSDEFEIKEIREEGGIKVSMMKITLYKVRNGNFRSEGIDLDEFMNVDTLSRNETDALRVNQSYRI